MQSGKPVGVFRTHEWAPRVLIANSNLVAEWANWDEFRRLEALGLTMYGQMTAGSWIYIGTQGILQGTYECFAEIARRRFGGSLAGTITLDRGPRRDGRRAAAGGDDERRRRPLHRGRSRAGSSGGSRPATSTSRPTTSTTRSLAAGRPSGERRALSVGLAGNAAEVVPELLRRGFDADVVTDQTERPRPAGRLRPGRALAGRGRRASRALTPTSTSAGPARRWPPTAPRWSASRTPARRSSTTATACAREAQLGGFERAFDYPGFVPAYIRPLFCEGKGPFRWAALSGDPADIAATDRAVLEEFPDDEALARWIRMAGERIAFQGLPARICWLGYGERRRLGLRFNELVRSGEVSAPIVIGRDHLDSGSVASPYRETEAMARRLRRDRRLAAAERARQHRLRARPGSASTTAAGSGSAARSTPGWSASPTAPSSPPRSSTGC